MDELFHCDCNTTKLNLNYKTFFIVGRCSILFFYHYPFCGRLRTRTPPDLTRSQFSRLAAAQCSCLTFQFEITTRIELVYPVLQTGACCQLSQVIMRRTRELNSHCFYTGWFSKPVQQTNSCLFSNSGSSWDRTSTYNRLRFYRPWWLNQYPPCFQMYR